jgi:hypothetical protein
VREVRKDRQRPGRLHIIGVSSHFQAESSGFASDSVQIAVRRKAGVHFAAEFSAQSRF